MKKETKGVLSLIFSIYGLINAPPISLFLFKLPLREWAIVFLIVGIIFGVNKKSTKMQKVGLIIGIVGVALILIGIIWALLFME